METTKVLPCTICHKESDGREVCISCLEEGNKDPNALDMRDYLDEQGR